MRISCAAFGSVGDIVILQTKLNSLQSELEALKDSSLHQKKRVTDMMVSLLKDLSDIGAVIGGSAAANKVTLSLVSVAVIVICDTDEIM